ncbi:MAG: hypothetical protein JWQ38_2435 [Flavipsychrobacter sp.]|nr:hypothetical protein [Flavipsychrobacter sp.]
MDEKKISVFLITYNHEPFIAQAIESILAQQTSYTYEIIIGEDLSPDGTRAICEQYAAQHPGIITLLPGNRNYGPQGNTLRTLRACKGQYIALCEGDDYWTDPHKLQKQVDFLEANPGFSLCFSAVTIKDEMGWNLPYEYYYPELTKDVFTIADFIVSEKNIIPTPTLLFRNVLPDPFPDFFTKAIAGDMGIQLFAADKGKAKYFTEPMAVYRNHAGGVTKSQENLVKGNDKLMQLYKDFNAYFDYRYDALFRQRLLAYYKSNLIYNARDKHGQKKLTHYFKAMPDYLKYSDGINMKELVYYHVVLFFPFLLRFFKSK